MGFRAEATEQNGPTGGWSLTCAAFEPRERGAVSIKANNHSAGGRVEQMSEGWVTKKIAPPPPSKNPDWADGARG